MSYFVGQFNKDSNDSQTDSQFLSSIGQGSKVVRTLINIDQGVWDAMDNTVNDYFKNEAFFCGGDNKFDQGKTYYAHVQIKRLRSDQTFRIKLLQGLEIQAGAQDISTGSNDTHQQYIKTIHIAPDTSIDHSHWVDCEFLFTPLQDFNVLFFELMRNSEDFKTRTIYKASEGENSLTVKSIQPRYASIMFLEVSEVNSIMGTQKVKNATQFYKMGVQGEPGTMMCINHEEIHIGKTGIYEIKNGLITVDFFSVVRGLQLDILNDVSIMGEGNTLNEKKAEMNNLLSYYEYPEEHSDEYNNLIKAIETVVDEDDQTTVDENGNEVTISTINKNIDNEALRTLFKGRSSTSFNFTEKINTSTNVRNIPAFSVDYTYATTE